MPETYGLFDQPDIDEILQAVAQFLQDDVTTAVADVDPLVGYHARVAANLVQVVRRELTAAGSEGPRRREVLTELGARSEAELALALRHGRLTVPQAEAAASVRTLVVGELKVSNPRYFQDDLGAGER